MLLNKFFLFGLIALTLVASLNAGKFFHKNGHVYFLSGPYKTNWHHANQYCNYMGMQLVEIHSPEQQDQFYEIAQANNPNDWIWIGGTDLGSYTLNAFHWVSSGMALVFTNWYIYDPNLPGQERCLMSLGSPAHNHTWGNYVCEKDFIFACEADVAAANTCRFAYANENFDAFKAELQKNGIKTL